MTKNSFGNGVVYYIGTQLDREGKADILARACNEADITSIVEGAEGLEIVKRTKEGKELYFTLTVVDSCINKIGQHIVFVGCTDLLTGKVLEKEMPVHKYDTYLVEK